jgi:hypothetical protein
MRLPSFADPENLKVPEEPKPEPIPDNLPLPELAEQVVRGKVKLTPSQQRMLIELLPFLMPKLSATTHVTDAGSFAQELDRAIDRSNKAKVIELRAEQVSED